MDSTNNSEELQKLWLVIRRRFFPLRPDLDQYQVFWSTRRQKRVLASCNIRRRLVRVAKELRNESVVQWLEPLLFHEMCHAVLDPARIKSKGKIRWHGREFRALERLHPRSAALDNWIKNGGFHAAVRSDRARHAARIRQTRRSVKIVSASVRRVG